MIRFCGWTRLLSILPFAVALSCLAHASSPIPDIAGGTTTSQYPSVGVVYAPAAGEECTGTAIAPHWVLTAAHCVQGNGSGNGAFQFVVGSDVTQYIGSGGSNTSGVTVYSVDYATHDPNYNSATVVHDVGLLHLTTAVPAVEFKLDSQTLSASIVGSQAQVMGYGLTNALTGNGLKRVATIALSSFNSNDIYSNYSSTSSGTCEGDSGGPLYVFDTDNAPLMRGVTSFGTTTQCNTNAETNAFQRIDIEVPYITSVVGTVCLDGQSCAAVFGSGICYVDGNTSGAQSGASWVDAYTDLQTALGDLNCSQVWVAKGVYKPTVLSDYSVSFKIRPGLAVYGGFAGTENQLTERVSGNVTVLSGDIDDNDAHHADTNIDLTTADIQGTNSYHVVRMETSGANITASTILDGFTITGGHAAAASGLDSAGGGLLCVGESTGHDCSPTLSNLRFIGNAAADGAALFNDGYNSGRGSPTLTGITFSGNGASDAGGAIYNFGESGGDSSPVLENVTFSANTAASGGAILNDGGGGNSSPKLSFVTFSGNSAGTCGGALYNYAVSNPSVDHAILWGDSAPLGNEICNNSGATATFINSDVQGSGGSGAGWNTGVGTDGGNNIDADPKLGILRNNGGFTPTFALGAGSAAIDAATDCNDAANNSVSTDQRGAPRPQGNACDLGAMEVVADRIFADNFDGTPTVP